MSLAYNRNSTAYKTNLSSECRGCTSKKKLFCFQEGEGPFEIYSMGNPLKWGFEGDSWLKLQWEVT